ncbi:hypothetical protein SNE40_015845 [Patella caerulea]|uniref:Uncharacterized protein n=1 Tax=Patella caerulea TaxID=87958 RepID=A0AAN8JKR0_PATCE
MLPSSSNTSTEPISTPTGSDFHIRDVHWADAVEIPFNKLPSITLSYLEKGRKLSSESRRHMVRVVVDGLREVNSNISTAQLRSIAKRIVKKYPILQDELDGQLIGTGYEGLVNQLVNRNDNSNRGKSPFGKKKKLNTEDEVDTPKSLAKKDVYGCTNFHPAIGDIDAIEELRIELLDISKEVAINWSAIEEKFKKSYPLQRKEINAGVPVNELLSRWPTLFMAEGIVLHFTQLTAINLISAFDDFMTRKGERLIAFFRNVLKDDLKSRSPATEIILSCMRFMKESNDQQFFMVDETTTAREVEKHRSDSPCIAVLGTSPEDATEFMIVIDNVVTTTTNSFKKAFTLYFGLYYVLNIEYPIQLSGILEFVQRCFVGINPDGCKAAKSSKRKKSAVNTNVLRLITELTHYEWTE